MSGPDYEEQMARARLREVERLIADAPEGPVRESLLSTARGLASDAEWWRFQRLKALTEEQGE